MKKSKILMLSSLVTMSLLFSACGGSSSPSPSPSASTDASAAVSPSPEASATVSAAPAASSASDATMAPVSDAVKNATLKIAIVSSPSGVDDGSFNEDNYNGILNFIKTSPGSTVKSIVEPTGDTSAAIQAVAGIVADYDVFVLTGFQFSGIGQIAIDNPDKKFILVDSNPTPVGDQKIFDNVYAMTFKEQESGFLAGISAALETKTGKVAVVNGVAYPSNVNYQYGFMSGVNYANGKLNSKATIVELPQYAGIDTSNANVGGNYVGGFADPATGKVVGNALLKQGVDIALVAAGGSGNGVFTAFKEAGGNVKCIGCDVDQYNDGINGSSNFILTSALKNMAINVQRSLNTVAEGTFKGDNVLLDATTDSTGLVTAEGRQQLSQPTIDAVNSAYALIKAGTIVPASSANGYKPDDFPGLK